MQVVILAGGAGTRLRPVVSDRPKSMAGFSEKPFLEYQLETLRRQGLRHFLFCVGYMHEHIQRHFGDGSRWGVEVSYSIEDSALGTAGALEHAASMLEETFLLANGDSFLEIDVPAFVDFHRRKRREDPLTLGTLALIHVEDASAFGSVEIDADQRLAALCEKQRSGPAWISAGFYALQAEILSGSAAGPRSLERELLPAALHSGHSLYGYLTSGFFVDIGTPSGHDTFRRFAEGMQS